MAGLLSALNAGKTSLRTNQKAVEISGNNIANVNTPGYSRQVPIFQQVPSLELNGFFIGQGVNISSITREYDVFITRQLIDKSATLGEEGAKSAPLAELERIFGVGENGIATEIDRYFDAWAELAANPSGQTERQVVIQRGEMLASSFREAVNSLQSAQQNIDATVESKVSALNPMLREIADLNLRIANIEAAGQTANTDRDRRDILLEEVSKAIGATFYEENSMVSVQLPGGMPLVQDTTAMTLETYPDVSNRLQLRLDTGGSSFDLQPKNLGGELKGMISVRDQFIPARLSELDHLAYSLATAVNAAHQAGSELGGGPAGAFFGPLPLVEAGFARNMTVVPTDPDQVAAGTGPTPGDNKNALDIAAIGKSLTVVDGNDSFLGYYSKITSKVGLEANRSELTLGGIEDAMVQLRNLRDGAVGVSIEEEMVNLMQYQKGFEASAKFLTTVDELMQTLLDLKR